MRAIIGYVGLTLPVVLLLAGAVDRHIESSLSAYYYTKVGNVFTGALCVIGIFLLAYRLTSWAIDNIATTLAGISTLGVARWRTNWYMALGALIWLSIVLMPTLNWLAASFYDRNHVFFILETACVMAFAVSFILNGHGQPSDPGFGRMAGQPPSAAILPLVGRDTTPATSPMRVISGKPLR